MLHCCWFMPTYSPIRFSLSLTLTLKHSCPRYRQEPVAKLVCQSLDPWCCCFTHCHLADRHVALPLRHQLRIQLRIRRTHHHLVVAQRYTIQVERAQERVCVVDDCCLGVQHLGLHLIHSNTSFDQALDQVLTGKLGDKHIGFACCDDSHIDASVYCAYQSFL
jgi:hypothetical protein